MNQTVFLHRHRRRIGRLRFCHTGTQCSEVCWLSLHGSADPLQICLASVQLAQQNGICACYCAGMQRYGSCQQGLWTRSAVTTRTSWSWSFPGRPPCSEVSPAAVTLSDSPPCRQGAQQTAGVSFDSASKAYQLLSEIHKSQSA